VAAKLNCWEFKNCGREKGGLMAGTLGVCPVACAMHCDGLNGGRAGGRVCWTIVSSGNRLCSRGVQSRKSCLSCDFYRRVIHEEAENVTCQFHTSIVDQSD
jgi:hypothetical protein